MIIGCSTRTGVILCHCGFIGTALAQGARCSRLETRDSRLKTQDWPRLFGLANAVLRDKTRRKKTGSLITRSLLTSVPRGVFRRVLCAWCLVPGAWHLSFGLDMCSRSDIQRGDSKLTRETLGRKRKSSRPRFLLNCYDPLVESFALSLSFVQLATACQSRITLVPVRCSNTWINYRANDTGAVETFYWLTGIFVLPKYRYLHEYRY